MMESPLANRSVVTYRGFSHGSDCGYCGSPGTKKSRGMWAHSLTVQDYEDLIERNWRRSGTYCYQPMMRDTCCPQYMIFCDTPAFRPSRHQRKLIRRMNRFLVRGRGAAEDEELEDQLSEQPGTEAAAAAAAAVLAPATTAAATTAAATDTARVGVTADDAAEHRIPIFDDTVTVPLAEHSRGSSASIVMSREACKSESVAKVKGKKAKQLRLERKLHRLASRGDQQQPLLNKQESRHQNSEQSLEDLLDEHKLHSDPVHRFELRLVQSEPRSTEFQKTLADEYRVYRDYQMVIHKDSSAHCSKEQFERFLVESPLIPQEINGVACGSFHYQYVLDGQIIAVEVMDVLPRCISSKYFFYDPQYSFLSLGTYSALCGIRLTRDLQRRAPGLSRYLMGYYIHSCQKMRYKAQFRPSFLLCPETYHWVPLEACLPLLDANRYARLSSSSSSVTDEDGETSNGAIIWHTLRRDGHIQTCRRLPENAAQRARIAEYLSLVGRDCSDRLVLYES